MRKIVIIDGETMESRAKAVELAVKNNLGIECQQFYNPNYLREDPQLIHKVNQQLQPISFRSIHGPFCGLSTGVHDWKIREVTMFRFKEALEQARELGVHDIVIHYNYAYKVTPVSIWRQYTIPFYKEFAKELDGSVRIHIENCLEPDPELIAETIFEVDSPYLDACIDVGHVNANTRTTVEDWCKVLKDKVGYVHLHNNHGEVDEHNALDNGTLDMDKTCRLLEDVNPEMVWCIETMTGQERSVEWMKEHHFII